MSDPYQKMAKKKRRSIDSMPLLMSGLERSAALPSFT
jgi:hypothetical protein